MVDVLNDIQYRATLVMCMCSHGRKSCVLHLLHVDTSKMKRKGRVMSSMLPCWWVGQLGCVNMEERGREESCLPCWWVGHLGFRVRFTGFKTIRGRYWRFWRSISTARVFCVTWVAAICTVWGWHTQTTSLYSLNLWRHQSPALIVCVGVGCVYSCP